MKAANPSQIPAHTNCRNCGKCCGVIPVTDDELTSIRSYLESHPFSRRYASQHTGHITCPFRDDKMKCCLIYEVRPVICRLFGVTEGMQCVFGNTCEIDGHPYIASIASSRSDLKALNFQDWSK